MRTSTVAVCTCCLVVGFAGIPADGFGAEAAAESQGPNQRFLTPVRLGPLIAARRVNHIIGEPDPLFDRLCETTTLLQRTFLPSQSYETTVPLNCGPTVTDRVTPVGFFPPRLITADLPHLRFNMVLREMSNTALSGGGIDQDPAEWLDAVFATWLIQSPDASVQIPDLTDVDFSDDAGFGLYVPNPGEVWPIDHANGIYQAIILNGCSASTVVRVNMDSRIVNTDGDVYGAVALEDQIVGNGYYVFSYGIQATEPGGGTSLFSFSGDAWAFCTGQSSL